MNMAMTKEFKNIKQLKTDEKHLAKRQAELEAVIRTDWNELKESVRIKNLMRSVLADEKARKKGIGQNILKIGLPYLGAIIVDRLLNFAKRVARS